MKKVFILFILFMFVAHAFAKKEIIEITIPKEPVNISAKKMKVDSNKDIVEAFGNVYLTSSHYKIRADYARYERKQKRVYLKGNIFASWDKNNIYAKELLVYVSNSTGWIKSGDIFYAVPHLYFRGEKIDKTGKNTFAFKHIEVTGCDSDVPDWSFVIKRGDIKDDGEARLYHVKFKIKNHTIFYFPYLQVPVLVKRKSGFLIPEYYSSSIDGNGLILPYYLALSIEQDITFYPGYLGRRGKYTGIEYRFTPDVQTKGFFLVSYLKDKIRYKTETDAPSDYSGDGLIRPNENRYWIRGKLDGYVVSPELELKLDVDYTSDQDFLRKFDSGYLGFERSRKEFLNVFGRDINNKDDLLRKNTLLLNRGFNIGNLYLKAEYYENLKYKNHNLDPVYDDTVQRVPEIGFNLYKTPLFGGLIDLESDSSISYFYRRYGVQGMRIDIYPSLSKTISTDIATIIPKISLRDSAYFLKDRDPELTESFENRYLFEFDLNISTQLYKVFDFSLNKKNYLIKHIITPEIKYFYRSTRSREDIPSFDSIDSLSREQKITYSLDNHFTLKYFDENNAPLYRNVLRLKLSETYDIKEAGREQNLKKYPKRPFTDIRTEYEFTPLDKFNVNGNIWISPYIPGITEAENRVDIKFLKQINGYISHDYKRELKDDIHRQNQEKLSNLEFGTTFSPNNKWEISYSDNRDLTLAKTIERKLTINYKHQCWSVATELSHTRDEDKIMIIVTLGTLGEVSQGFNLK
ncbi:LPS assembly protein LptD [Desulfothermus naphthae]